MIVIIIGCLLKSNLFGLLQKCSMIPRDLCH